MTFVMSVSLTPAASYSHHLDRGNVDVARVTAGRPLRSGWEASIRDPPLTAENRSPAGPQIIRPDCGVNRTGHESRLLDRRSGEARWQSCHFAATTIRAVIRRV